MKNSTQTVIGLVVMGVLAAGNIAFVDSGVWNARQGEAVALDGLGADRYQVENVSILKDGSYMVTGKAAGFQSDIEIAVTFDRTGTVVKEASVISQGETEGIGTKITDPSFTGGFAGITAPIGLAGKKTVVASPVVMEVAAGAEGEAVEFAPDNVRLDPQAWNPEDQSPEAKAARKLYESGLSDSGARGVEMMTAVADMGPEEQAAAKMNQAGLSEVTAAEEKTVTVAGQAMERMNEAGLLEFGKEKPAVAGAEPAVDAAASEVDAVAGATVSSTGMVTVINNSYYFLKEQVIK